jgi:hypothetical protein
MKFLLYEKDLWEITLGELLPLKVEFGEIVFEGSTLEHRLFTRRTNWFVEHFS